MRSMSRARGPDRARTWPGAGTAATRPDQANLTKAEKIRILAPLFAVPARIWSHPLANIKSAKKRARQAVKRNMHNASLRSMMRTAVKQVIKAIDGKDKAAAEAAYKSAEPLLDRFSSRGLIHKNKAARHKSRINARIRALA
jgi:small subunit ribosomal protein S20